VAEKVQRYGRLRYLETMKLFGRNRSDKGSTEAAAELEGGGPAASSEMADVLSVASDRIAAIVTAAETASSDIRQRLDGRASGDGSHDGVAEELARALATRADELRADADSLATILSRASQQLASAAPPAGAATTEPDLPAGPPAAPPPVTPAPAAPSSGGGAPFRKSSSAPPPAPAPSPPPAPEAAASAPFAVIATPVAAEEPVDELEAEDPELDERLSQRVTDRFTPPEQAEGHAPARFKPRASTLHHGEDAPTYSAEGVRLLATQMAVAGSSREEIEARLSEEFGVQDTSELLSEVLRGRSGLGRNAI
jgi:hypothetical protein